MRHRSGRARRSKSWVSIDAFGLVNWSWVLGTSRRADLQHARNAEKRPAPLREPGGYEGVARAYCSIYSAEVTLAEPSIDCTDRRKRPLLVLIRKLGNW